MKGVFLDMRKDILNIFAKLTRKIHLNAVSYLPRCA